MKPFKLHLTFGFILILIGIVFDYCFVQSKVSEAFKTDPLTYINSFKHQLYSLNVFYMFALGFLNIALALLIPHLADNPKFDWIIFYLIFIGSILLIATGFWYASAGPSFKWETRCTVLTIGLGGVIFGLGFELYKILSVKDA